MRGRGLGGQRLFVVVLACALAGCVGGGTKAVPNAASGSTEAAPPTAVDVGEGTGTVTGTVIEEDLAPVPEATVVARLVGSGAAVSLLAMSASAESQENRVTSGPDGKFKLSGLAPGTYTFIASKKGFHDSAARTASVKADETADVRLVLVALPSDQPSKVTVPFVLRLNTIVVRTPAGDQTIIRSGNLNPTDTTDYRYGLYHTVEESPTAPLQTVLLEARWTSTQELCSFGVKLRVTGPGADDHAEAKAWAAPDPAKNPSALRIQREGQDADAMMSDARTLKNGGKPIQTAGKWFTGANYEFVGTAGAPVDASCAVDQRADAWASYFLGEPAPAEWTALE